MADVDVADIQSDLVDAIAHRFAHHLIVRIDDRAAARRVLTDVLGLVTGGSQRGPAKPALLATVGLSARGLAALGVDDATISSLGDAFVAGMAARADVLGDRGVSAPDHWPVPLAQGDGHLLIWLHGVTDDVIRTAAEDWAARLARAGLAVVHEVRATRRTDGREHFGFGDGFGQPNVAGFPNRHPTPINPPLPAGEFVIGYPDAAGYRHRAARTSLGRNGSILVWRLLRQDVAGFRAWVQRESSRLGMEAALLAAKVVGRWADGTPLVLSPEAPLGRPGHSPAAHADYSYCDDPNGQRCPFGAHTRRANPRDDLAFATITKRHRIIRRGMPFGEPLPEGADDDGATRGLVFACFNADPARQFEFVQQHWINDGDRLRLGSDRDPLVGSVGTDRLVLNGFPPVVLTGIPQFVTTLGGEYFFAPSLRALAALATG